MNIYDAILPSLRLGKSLDIEDEDEQEERELDPNYFTNQVLRSLSKPFKLEPRIDEETESSLLGKTLGTLQTIGNVLDTPRAISWQALAGRSPTSVANPFNRESVAERITGWDVLKKLGIEGKEGFDWTDPLAIGLEIVGDPLFYLTGPLRAITKLGMKAGTRAAPETITQGVRMLKQAAKGTLKKGKVLGSSPAAIVEEIAKGERALGGMRIPLTNLGFTFNYGLSPETAAKVAKAYYYGKYSPIPYLRELFSPIVSGVKANMPGIGNLAQWQHDLAYSRMRDYFAIRDEIAPLLEGKFKMVADLWNDVGEYARTLGGERFANVNDFIRYIGELKSKSKTLVTYAGSLRQRDETVGVSEILDELFQTAPPQKTAEARALAEYTKELADDIKRLNAATYDMIAKYGGKAELLSDTFSAHMPRFATSAKYAETGDLPTKKRLVNTFTPDALERQAIFKMPGGTNTIQLASKDPLLTSDTINKTQLNALLDQELLAFGVQQPKAKLLEKKSLYLWHKYIKPELDAEVIRGTIDYPTADRVAFDWINNNYLAPAGITRPENYMSPFGKSPNLAYEMAKYLSRQPKEVLKTGIFGRPLLEDWLQYQKHSAVSLANLLTAHKLANDLVTPITQQTQLGPGKLTLDKAWNDAVIFKRDGNKLVTRKALNSDGLVTFVKNFVNDQIQKNTPWAQQLNNAVVKILYDPTASPNKRFLAAKNIAQKIAADEQLPNVLSKYVEINTTDVRSWLGRTYDWLNDATRNTLTWPWPAFHVRNRIDGLWRNIIFANPSTYHVSDLLKHELELLKVSATSAEKSGIEAIEKLKYGKQYLQQLQSIFGPSPTSEFVTLGKTADEAVGSFKQILFGTGTAPAGEGIIKKVVTAYPRLMKRLYQYTELSNRYPVFAAAMDNGKSPTQAMAIASEVQYQYGQRIGGAMPGSIARKTMPRLVTFWNFLSQNIPFQLKMLLNTPGGGSAQTIRLFSRMREGENKYIPGWIREQTAISLGGPEEAASFIRSFGLSLEQMGIPVWTTDAPIPHPFTQRTIDKAVSMLAPIFQLPFVLYSQKDPFTGRPAKELEGVFSKLGLPHILDIVLRASPASRAGTFITSVTDEKRTPAQKLLDVLSGVKIGTYDMRKQKSYEMESIINDILKTHPDVRQFVRSYIPKEKRETAAPEVEKLIKIIPILEKERKKFEP